VIRCAFVVRGRVQGVGFRWFVAEAAAEHGISGFVRNDQDGSVRGEAEGEPAAIAAFLAALRRGPRHARVDGVATEPLPPRSGSGFTIAR